MPKKGTEVAKHVPLKDRTWARVLGGAIGTLVTGIALDKLKVLPIGNWIIAAVNWVWAAVTATYKLPAWLTWLLITGCIAFGVRWYRSHRRSKEITFQRYTEDTFHDLKWQWRYGHDANSTGLMIGSIIPYCPKCSVRMNLGGVEYPSGNQGVVPISCLSCEHAVKLPTGPTSDIRERIGGLVEREITSGAWKSKIAPAKSVVSMWY